MTDTVIARVNSLPMELRIEIYSQMFHVNVGPLEKLHEEREWVRRTQLPSLEVCRRLEAYNSYRSQCPVDTETGVDLWTDDAEEAFFKGLSQLPRRLENLPWSEPVFLPYHEDWVMLATGKSIAEVIHDETGLNYDRETVLAHHNHLRRMLYRTIEESNPRNRVLPKLIFQLTAVDRYRMHDFLFRFLGRQGLMEVFGQDMRGLGVLIRNCSIGFRSAIKRVRMVMSPSYKSMSRYLRDNKNSPYGDSMEPILRELGFVMNWAPAIKQWTKKNFDPNQQELFLEKEEDGEAKFVMEIREKSRKSKKLTYY